MYEFPGTTVILFLYAKAPAPGPTATTLTLVTPAGAVQVVFVVYTACPGATEVVIELLAELAELCPALFVALTVNV